VREAEGRAEAAVQAVKEELHESKRYAEQLADAAAVRERRLSVENQGLLEQVHRLQAKVEESEHKLVALEQAFVAQSQGQIKDANARVEQAREEAAAAAAVQQRSLDAVRHDLNKEMSARIAASRRADEAEGEAARCRAELEAGKKRWALEQAEVQGARDAAVRQLEASSAAAREEVAAVEERLRRCLIRAEAGEAEAAEQRKRAQALQASEQEVRAALEQLRGVHAREVASKTQTLEALRDSLAASEEQAKSDRRAVAVAKEELRQIDEGGRQALEAVMAAKERAEAEVQRLRAASQVAAEKSNGRVQVLERELDEQRRSLSGALRERAAVQDECMRLSKNLERLQVKPNPLALSVCPPGADACPPEKRVEGLGQGLGFGV
jgi:colicin import membrane protein